MTLDAARDTWQQPERLLQALRVSPGATVADVGAGSGYFTEHLRHYVGPTGYILALDRECRLPMTLRTPNVLPILYKDGRLPLKDEVLDGAVLLAVLGQAGASALRLLARLTDALKCGAHVVCSDQEWSLCALLGAFRTVGLEIVEAVPCFTRGSHRLRHMSLVVGKRP